MKSKPASEIPVARIVPAPVVGMPLPELIAREQKRQRRRLIGWISGLLAIAVAAALLWLWQRPRPAPLALRFRTIVVTHGELIREVRATGHVEAVSTVSVGAEISGRIASVEVSYNDRVKAGQVLARFDRNALEAQRAQADALTIGTRAQLGLARLDHAQARSNSARADNLFARGAMANAEHEVVVTALALAAARVSSAEASLAAQEAMAKVARTNLDHTVIRSPIDGVIITREVDPGQTVASMLQTPVLFTVAADLRRMEVVAAVDEADVAMLAVGQPAPFTVNAYQDRIFEGTVTEIRNAARVVQDVVTYGTVVSVDNLDFALKPSMTAAVKIQTGKAQDVDLVPNAALRFVPPNEVAVETPGVWVLAGDHLQRVAVQPGLSDGELTAVTSLALEVGARVIVDLTPEGKRAYDLAQPKD